jgi:hypothetical protein
VLDLRHPVLSKFDLKKLRAWGAVQIMDDIRTSIAER